MSNNRNNDNHGVNNDPYWFVVVSICQRLTNDNKFVLKTKTLFLTHRHNDLPIVATVYPITKVVAAIVIIDS